MQKPRLTRHFHFCGTDELADAWERRIAELGISPSRAGRDALALWLKHTSESRAVRAYVAERQASLTLPPRRRVQRKTGSRR